MKLDLDMVLNELSLRTPAADEEIARELMSQLISTLSIAVRLGIKTLRTQSNIYSFLLATNYPLARWLNDSRVDQEERDFLLTLQTQTPLLSEIVESEIQQRVDISEFKYQEEVTTELGIAYLLDALAVSLNSNPKWNYSSLELEVTRLNEDDELIEEKIKVVHGSDPNHIREHADWIENRLRTGVIDGLELWKRKEQLLPHLEFCDNVRKQLENIRKGQLELQPVLKALFELDKCSQNWITGGFTVENSTLEESGESETTVQNPKYRQARIFLCPDREERLFARHVKLRFCNWRIHFCPKEPGKVIIGYIGEHLPTSKFRT